MHDKGTNRRNEPFIFVPILLCCYCIPRNESWNPEESEVKAAVLTQSAPDLPPEPNLQPTATPTTTLAVKPGRVREPMALIPYDNHRVQNDRSQRNFDLNNANKNN
jgi:hypothetical protein